VAGSKGGDAAAVAYDAVASARQRGADIVLVDTAGRQHTRKDLMAELGKIRRTVDKACPGAPHEVFLTVDASTGTNALHQAREFGRLCDISGLILTKLDGTGKGGVVVAIRHELGHPIRFVGLGERMEDLQPFDVDMFVRAMFA
jgi:fused signal recognition particle receptor